MISRTIIILAVAGLTALVLARTSAGARGGGGGFFRGGGWSVFHPAMHFEGRHDEERDVRGDGHGADSHRIGPWNLAGHGEHDHSARFDEGHWHRSPGFGDKSGHPPSFDGAWHAGSGFGDRSQRSPQFDGQWHAGSSFGDNSHRSPGFDGQWHVGSETR
jgi:hypothetical protein